MISIGTKLIVSDNSGAKLAKCIKILGGSKTRKAQINEIIIVSIKDANVKSKLKVEAGQVHRGLILETKKGIRRKDGAFIKPLRNRVILVNAKNMAVGSRISGIGSYELRKKFGSKLASLTKGTV